MFTSVTATDFALGSVAVLLLAQLVRRRKQDPVPLPPGPKPLPVIGNLLDLPKPGEHEAPHYARFKELYGPISSLNVFGTTLIVVNDTEIIFDLLEKRSLNYSSRPQLTMGSMVGWGGTTPLMQYNADLKMHRREFQQYIGTSTALAKYTELEEVEARRLLYRILNDPDPENVMVNLRKSIGAVILKIAYGYSVTPHGEDPLVNLADKAMTIFSEACSPGKWIVDIFPSLRYLPKWLPGMGFKRIASEYNKHMSTFLAKPFAFTRLQMEAGVAKPSFAGELIERNDNDDYTMKWLAATLYGGGSDTSVSVLSFFILAMALHPEIQRKAHAEIDAVLGRNTLPSLADRLEGRLPYVNAIQKEVIRWRSTLPMGVAHVATEDDTYRGFRIPKGAVVLPNVWQMSHDPNVYHDPSQFKPERFLGPNPELDPTSLVFGFGRRVCAGLDLASGTIFLAMSMILATFEISKAIDTASNEIEPICDIIPGVINHPKAFEFSIKPRDEKAVALIESVLDEHPFEYGDIEVVRKLKGYYELS